MSEATFSLNGLPQEPTMLSMPLPFISQTGLAPLLITDKGISTKDEAFLVHIPGTDQMIEIDPQQLWFWSSEWQAGERQVDRDLQMGQYEEFDNFDDFLASL